MQKKYLIGFYSKQSLYKLDKFDYYKVSFSDLNQQGIEIIYFYKENASIDLDTDFVNRTSQIMTLKSYKKESDVVAYLQTLEGEVFINTFEEAEILFVNSIRGKIGQKITNNPKLFLDKFLQRDCIGEQYPETVVNYKVFDEHTIKNIDVSSLPYLPLIIKPTGGVQSKGVYKIEKIDDLIQEVENSMKVFEQLKKKRLFDQKILIEQFIDGDMYTIDYYVDQDQNIFLTKPVLVKLGWDYGIEDFCNTVRVISGKVEHAVNQDKLQDFVRKTVLGGNIRNTFVHHEFKINLQGIFKTIETNGRIGGYRMDMYQKGYGTNILSFPFIQEKKKLLLENNVAVFALYPKKEQIFEGFNEDLLEKISKLSSFERMNKGVTPMGIKIGLTKNGFGKVASLVLSNSNYEEFQKDLNFVEKEYFNIII